VSVSSSSPAEAWAALSPHLAGQPRVRLSRDGGKSYPQKYERDLTAGLPTVPAAVRIFGKDGTCAAIFLDFDSSLAGIDWVEADVRAVQKWLHRLGARWIEDYSPNGGRHIYIPLAQRVTFNEARDLVEALGTRLRTLDKTPHQNILHGCMRTPGSPHKRGGYQQLAMSLNVAYDIVRRPNGPDIWNALTADLAEEMKAVQVFRTEQTYTPSFTGKPVPDPHPIPNGRMSRAMQRIAVTGLYETHRYATDSEARQAVLAGAAASGLSLMDVDRRMKQGIWPGLTSFFARYPARHRSKALQRDWHKAVRFIKQKRRDEGAKDNARISPTSKPNTQAGGLHDWNSVKSSPEAEHRFIRSWRNALTICESRYQESRTGLARRMVLRALGEAAHKTGSRFIEFGDRSLAVATGLDHTTVGSHLRELRREKDPLITLVEAGRGTHGDLYMLTIPEQMKARVEDAAWRPGKLHALRPVFRALGLPAAYVYEALETSPTPLSIADLVRISRLSRTAVTEALEILGAWNLATRGSDRSWELIRATCLRNLAEYFGVLEAVAEQVQRYKAERVRWREWLANRVSSNGLLPHPEEDYPWHTFEGPPDEWTLSDIAFSQVR
jgi:DNA-binding transcriptional ArsR family regulator